MTNKTTLIIDTAFETCQVGVWQGDTCVTMAAVPGGGKHDIILAPLVEEIFKVHKIKVADIARIVVTTGPGRFTGLRVGIAFARGLALVHQTPMAGVLTTDALAWEMAQAGVKPEQGAVIVSVKRGESFIYRQGHEIQRVMDDELSNYLDQHKGLIMAGVFSPEAEALLTGRADITMLPEIREPSLEAIFAVSKDIPATETAIIRPYYAI